MTDIGGPTPAFVLKDWTRSIRLSRWVKRVTMESDRGKPMSMRIIVELTRPMDTLALPLVEMTFAMRPNRKRKTSRDNPMFTGRVKVHDALPQRIELDCLGEIRRVTAI